MSRLQVFTASNGTDWTCLDTIGAVAGLRFSTSRNGDLAASWQMQLSPRTDHSALAPGRLVAIPIGASKGWQGVLGNPRRGDTWQFTAAGLPSLANNYDAIASTTGNALVLNEIVDEAIVRGLPWTRSAAMPALTNGTQGSGVGSLTDALNTVCDAKAQIWNVNRSGALTAAVRSTTIAYLLLANDTAGGRNVTGFVTDVHVTYQRYTDYALITTLRSAAARPYGRFEAPLDLTPLGPITTTQANEHGDNWLTKQGARLQFTGAFTVAPGQLVNPGGTPVDLSTVQASDGLIRVMLTDPDSAAGELSTGPVSLPVSETDYDVDSGVLTVTPLDTTPVGLAAVF